MQPENYPFLARLRRELDIDHPHVMVCESPGDPIGFAAPTACGASFAFGHSDALVKAGRGDEKAIREVADYFVKAPDTMATMVSNHDHFAGKRLWDAMGGDPARVRVAAAAYLLQPGTPYLYYGEELGMSAAATDDPDGKLRGPMSWTPTGGFSTGTPYRPASTNLATNNAQSELADPDSMLAFYTAMLRLRNAPSVDRPRPLRRAARGRPHDELPARVRGRTHRGRHQLRRRRRRRQRWRGCRRTPVCSACIRLPARRVAAGADGIASVPAAPCRCRCSRVALTVGG